jgi:hypothetical protein
MKQQIEKWFAWLKQATSQEDEQLAHVYSDGTQLWATNGYVLHAVDVATEKRGHVSLTDAGLFAVEEAEDIPPFIGTLPEGDPIASIVVSAGSLKQAVAGQEGFVQINLYGESQSLELQSAGKYALVSPVADVPGWWFWRPK